MPRRKAEVDDLLLYQIAKMYYIDNLTQDAISSATCFSRSHVSRLLEKARERGLVTFVVKNPVERLVEELEERLRDMFHLRFVAVEGVTSDEYQGISRRNLIECLAQKAADTLPLFLSESKIVAVGIGRTMYAISKRLAPPSRRRDLLVLPAIGTTSTTTPQTQSNLIVENVSSHLGSRRYFTTVPIVVDQDEMSSRLYRRRYDELTRQWDGVDTAVIGLGGPYLSTDPFNLNEASEYYRERVASSDIAGDILASFFFEDGTELELGGGYVKNAMSLDRLRSVDRVLCVAGGPKKVRGLRAALSHGFVNCLITDSVTAAEVISLQEAPR